MFYGFIKKWVDNLMISTLSPISFSILKQKFKDIQYLMHLEKNVCVP